RWNEINRMLFDEKLGHLIVGETHLNDEQVNEIERAYPRMRIYNTIDPDHPNKGGVAVVLNRDITNTEGVSVRRLVSGRAILVTIPWHARRTLTILGLYAPTGGGADNRDFWDMLSHIWLTEDVPVPDAAGGDVNVVTLGA
ncbi:hypothetical protein DFH07DRAFT_736761, partial [Mycena maculata]